MITTPLSVLDLAAVDEGESVTEALNATVALAQRAEQLGYRRVWYAEHHNIGRIASSATSVLIAHVAANTSTIRLGSGGVMLPNHSPLVIAEQFGTLAALHPDRIDLGLGRAPGTDQITWRALRRDARASENFPQDVLELQGYLADESRVPGVRATPGQGTKVPLYILGSSLFGAQLAAALGLPYAFASHFAPDALVQAAEIYRRDFQPSEQLSSPHFIAGVNVIACETEAEAEAELLITQRQRVQLLFGRQGHRFTDEEADGIFRSPRGHGARQMLHYSAVGTPETVGNYVQDFAIRHGADEVMVVLQGSTASHRLRALELLASVTAPAVSDQVPAP